MASLGQELFKHRIPVPFPWLGHDGLVHIICALFQDTWELQVLRTRVRMTTGEARTMCGWRLGNNTYRRIDEVPTCFACILHRQYEPLRNIPGHPEGGDH